MRATFGILILLACLAAALPAAALDAAALIAAAPPADTFPDEDVVVLHHAETVEVAADGRVTHRVHTLRRLQTQWAMRRQSDVRVAWDASRQDLQVVTARTFMRDGTVVPTPDNGFNEVTPGAVSRAAPFLDWREMVISHVGTEPGCVVELEYVLRDRAPGPLPASGVAWLGQEHPVLESRVTVTGAPVRMAPDGVVAGQEGDTWTLRELPAFRDAGPAAHRPRWVPHLVWGRLDGPTALEKGLRGHLARAATSDEALTDWLAEVRRDPEVLTDADLLQRIAALVHDATAGVHLPGGPWAAAPRPAGEVFATALGTDWERALLALALLRAAGWQPELGVFGPSPLDDGQLVAADRFDHLRVVVQMDGENWWLAPERAEAWPGHCDLAGWTGLFVAAGGDHRVYTVPVRPGTCRWSAHLAPDGEGGWTAMADLELQGPYRPGGRDSRAVAEELAARLLPDGEVRDLEVREESTEQLALRFTAGGATLGEVEQSLLIRELPWPSGALLDHLPAGFHAERPAREAPLWIEYPGREQVSLSISLPDGWRLDAPRAGTRELTAPAASFRETVREEDGTLVIERVLEIAADRVAPEDYPALREVLAAGLTADQHPLILIEEE